MPKYTKADLTRARARALQAGKRHHAYVTRWRKAFEDRVVTPAYLSQSVSALVKAAGIAGEAAAAMKRIARIVVEADPKVVGDLPQRVRKEHDAIMRDKKAEPVAVAFAKIALDSLDRAAKEERTPRIGTSTSGPSHPPPKGILDRVRGDIAGASIGHDVAVALGMDLCETIDTMAYTAGLMSAP
jgi:hypothetical protein